MKTQQTKSQKFESLIKYYKGKSIENLRLILPKWAYGNDSDKILDISLHPKNIEYLFFLVDTVKLIQHSELHEVNANLLFTNDVKNDTRVTGILTRWENNEYVDPPTIGIFEKNKLCFSDGRHRAKTAYLLGHEYIPVAVHVTDVEKIKEIIKLTPQ